MNAFLGQLVLGLHIGVIAFNVVGLLAIPIGGALRWRWVRIRWWRLLHLVSWVVVAAQATVGRACFLTIWQDDLTGGGAQDPLIMRVINGLIYWPLPMWVFTALYLALFAAVVALWWLVPPGRRYREAPPPP